MEVKTLSIDQTSVAKLEIGIVKEFVSCLDPLVAIGSEELLAALTRIERSDNILLKSVDSPFAAFLSKMLSSFKHNEQSQRTGFVKELEDIFQSQRATNYGQELLNLTLAPLLNEYNPKTIWLPGCGKAFEAAWIDKKFPGVETHYIDIDTEAITRARQRINNLNLQNATLWDIDLTNLETFPGRKPDLVLFFNPFVIEDEDYFNLAIALSDKKTTDAKAESILTNLRMNAPVEKIFTNILNHMEKKTFFSITMDLAEAHIIYNFFSSKHIPVTCYRNPYAIKNLASLILGKRNPRVEPKIYHYVLVAQSTHLT